MIDRSQSAAKKFVPLNDSANRLKLSVFATNVSGGLSATSAAGVLKGGDWAEVKRLALAADAAGFDALIPIARWKGYGGATDWNDRSFETFTWAAGIAAITERIQVFATVQVPTVHPIRAAKECVTVDHISGGRFGLNIVAGWNDSEIRMFGQTLREHEQRYQAADEFTTFLKRLWAEQSFDFDGVYYHAKAAHSAPYPLQRPGPLIMSAGGSPAGADFAAKQADIQFLNMQTLEGAETLVAALKAKAWEKHRRRPQIMTCLYIICRDTEVEARDYFHHVVRETGDRQAARNMMDALIPNATFQITPDVLDHVCAGFGGLPLIGTPTQIVEALSNLADIGLDGVAISWIDYDEGIQQFHETLNPMLRAAGLRE